MATTKSGSVLQTIDLADELEFSPAAGLSVECDEPELSGDRNLVWQAATVLAEAHGVEPRAYIRLKKRIPVAMGLGGGSSDAAATLLALDRDVGIGLQRGNPFDGGRPVGFGRSVLPEGRDGVGRRPRREDFPRCRRCPRPM